MPCGADFSCKWMCGACPGDQEVSRVPAQAENRKKTKRKRPPNRGGVEWRLFRGQRSSPRSGVVWHTWARPAQLGVCCPAAWPCPGRQPAQTRCLSLGAWVPDGTMNGDVRLDFRRDCRPNPTSWIESACNPRTSTKKTSLSSSSPPYYWVPEGSLAGCFVRRHLALELVCGLRG